MNNSSLVLIGLAIIFALLITVQGTGKYPDFTDGLEPSLVSVYPWCDFEKGKQIGQNVCMKQLYTEGGELVITINRSIFSVPVRLEFVDSIDPLPL